MKKKLKVKKAFAGKMMRAATTQGRRVMRGKVIPSQGSPIRPGRGSPVRQPQVEQRQQPGPIGPRQQPGPIGPRQLPLGTKQLPPQVGPRQVGPRQLLVNPVRPPGTVRGSGAGIVLPGQPNPFGPGGLPIAGYGSQQPSSQIAPNSPRSLPFASAVGPGTQQPFQPQQPGTQQPIRDLTNLPSKPINVSSFNSTPVEARGGMRPGMQINSAPLQQAAPTQPVTAMKKGGVVRGGRAEIKGTRPAKLS